MADRPFPVYHARFLYSSGPGHRSAERDEVVAKYRGLIKTDEDRESFDGAYNTIRTIYRYAEDHLFRVEHWFHTIWFSKIRDLGNLLVNNGMLNSADDIFMFNRYEIPGLLADLPPEDVDALNRTSAEIQEVMSKVPIPPEMDAAIRDGYADLSRTCTVDRVPVAVRSSATAEDLPTASFAGQQDTYLWVTGTDEVIRNVFRCWARLFTPRVIDYRKMYPGHADQVLTAAVSTEMGAYGLKTVIVVDEDTDPWDISRVMYALSFRFQPNRSQVIKRGRSTPLDPSPPIDAREITGRLLLDATIPYEWKEKPIPIELDPDVVKRIEARWSELGL